MENLLITFIVITGCAVVIQMGILAALYLSFKKSSERMEKLATEMQTRAIPALESAQEILADAKPKVAVISTNLVDITTTLKGQIERMDLTVTDVVDRTRLQIIRADEMVSRAMDKVEETGDLVQHSVISPIRRVVGIVEGLTTGLNAFFGRRRGTTARPGARERIAQDEEMFI
jgi:hypothetical protein